MDLTQTIAPKSDQQNYDDYISGPKTVTVSEVRAGNAEQPVEVHLVEFPGRPYKPSKSMRRVLVAAWGPEAANYAGRRMTLYGDPTVRFGGQVVGGIKISHLSHIDKRLTLALTATRGKRAPHVVEPLTDDAPDLFAEIKRITKPGDLNALYNRHKNVWTDEHTAAASARKAELTGGAA
ncbi:hypothetical protein [Georgenia thermotolerans]|uniref:hypothetical protein n=1 Tax=Georgenia thermotolerans TaxID=527326 RepID=UPI00186B0AF5|nr:hypothetical protein [Georgenia thermotolerans]